MKRCSAGQLGVGDVRGEEAERAAGLDRGQLVRVADQPQRGAGRAGGGQQRGQPQGAGHAGLVDQDDVPAAQRLRSACRGVVEPLVDVVGPHPQLVAEHLGGCGRREPTR